MKKLLVTSMMAAAALSSPAQTATDSLIVRIAHIEVYPEYLDDYLAAAAHIGGVSVREEPGVVCIFPMQMADDPCQVRILEIYRSPAAYQSHLQTKHFLDYKTGTLKMVKHLELPSMQPLDPEAMPFIFAKACPPAAPVK